MSEEYREILFLTPLAVRLEKNLSVIGIGLIGSYCKKIITKTKYPLQFENHTN